MAFWQLTTADDPFNAIYDEISHGDTFLFQYYDFFYTKNNLGKLLGAGENQSNLKISHLRQYANEIKQTETIKTDYLNIDEQNGIIITFEAKIGSSCLSVGVTCTIVSFINQFVNPFVVTSKDGNSIELFLQTIAGVNLNVWNSFIVIVRNLFNPKCVLIIRDYENLKIVYPLPNKISTAQIQFGEPNSNHSIFISNVRIYKGTYLSNFNNCLISTQFDYPQCLHCQSGYFLDYQNYMKCTLSNPPNVASTNINGIKDWNYRINCPPNMILDQFNSSNCVCQKGYYLDSNNKCSKCPRYCKTCNINGCLIQHQSRYSNGNCYSELFDDGYNCIQNTFMIRSFSNFIHYFAKPRFGPDCRTDEESDLTKYAFTRSNFDLNTSYENFFVSFSLKLEWSNLRHIQKVFEIKADTNHILGYIELYYESFNRVQVKFYFYYSQNYPYIDVFVNYHEVIWIGIYIENERRHLVVNSNGQSIYRDWWGPVGHNFPNPKITLGYNIPSTSQIGCISLSPLPLQIVRGIPRYFSDINQLSKLMKTDKKLISRFIFNKSQPNFNQYSQDSSVNPSSVQLYFPNSLMEFNSYKGFSFTSNHHGVIQNLSNTNGPITFITFILINELTYQTSLLSYDVNGYLFEAFLIPNSSLEIATIRICFDNSCQDASYTKIYFKEITFLAILNRNMNPFSSTLTHLEFEIVCSYQRETMTFFGDYKDLTPDATNIRLGFQNQDSGSYQFYLNHIKIYQGDGFFYFDYENSHHCFLYVNLSTMNCLYLKKYFTYCNNMLKGVNDCISYMNSIRKQYFYQEYTQNYISTNLKLNLCTDIYEEDNEVKCAACTDINLNLEANCEKCKAGYYFQALTSKCLKCDFKCQECSGRSNYCTICKDENNQIPPNCNCAYDYQYKDQNLMCQSCDNRCATCYQNPDSCLKCADRRINPPYCYCDPYRYTDIGGECTEIQCNTKLCQSCVISQNNCTICAANRDNPPLCECEFGLVEQPDGTCRSCEDSFYYEPTRKICLPCIQNCQKCYQANSCDQCKEGFDFQNKACACPASQTSITLVTGESKCMLPLLVTLTATLVNKKYELQFQFSEELNPIDFQTYKLDLIMNIYFPLLSSEIYTVTNPVISSNILTVQLTFFKNISVQKGQVIFLLQSLIVSSSLNHAIDKSIMDKGLEFSIGPLLFEEETINKFQVQATLNSVTSLKETNQSLMESFQSVQFLFYILNTLQPTSMFLLVKLNYPPMLYSFYQLIGSFIFPFVPDYQSTKVKENFNLFGNPLNKKEVNRIHIEPYSKLGFSTSILVNIPIIIIKYLVFWFILFLCVSVQRLQIFLPKKILIEQIKTFVIDKLNSENEINLLSVLIAIYIQFYSEQEQYSWAFRAGYYFSILLAFNIIYSTFYNFFNINEIDQPEKQNYSKIFINRIVHKEQPIYRNYFFFQLLKKYVIVTIVFFLYNFPIYTCSLCGFIFFLSGLSTIKFEPYVSNRGRILKIISEFTLSTVWIIHIYFIIIEQKLNQEPEVDDDLLKAYQIIGLIVVFVLIAYNLLYLIDFGITLTISIKIFIQHYKEQKQMKKMLNDNIVETHYIRSQQQLSKNTQFTLTTLNNQKTMAKYIHTK